MILFENRGEGLVACLAFRRVDKIFRRGSTFFVGGLGGSVLYLISLLFLEVLEGLDAVEDLVALPLGPHEVVVTPLFKVTHAPPKARFKSGSHQDGIVASAYVVLVGWETCVREFYIVAVRAVNFHEELPVVTLLQLKILFLVLRVG